MEYNVNNISTIATWTALLILVIQTICKYFNIPIGENESTIIANAIIALAIAIWSSYNPNTIPALGNGPEKPIVNEYDENLNYWGQEDDNDGA